MSTIFEIINNFNSWKKILNIEKITKNVVDGIVVESATQAVISAIILPYRPFSINMKQTEMRLVKAYKLYVENNFVLDIEDIIIFENVKYRVFEKEDYSQFGFLKYGIMEALQ